MHVLAAFVTELHNEFPAPPGFQWVDFRAEHWLELDTDYYRVLTHCNGHSDVDIAIVALPEGVHVRVWMDYSEDDDDSRIYEWEDPELLDRIAWRVETLAKLWTQIAAKRGSTIG